MQPHEAFYSMDEAARIDYVWNRGKFLGSRQAGDITYFIYRLDDYYVEAQYNEIANTVGSFSAFSDTEKLIPYADDLNIG